MEQEQPDLFVVALEEIVTELQARIDKMEPQIDKFQGKDTYLIVGKYLATTDIHEYVTAVYENAVINKIIQDGER